MEKSSIQCAFGLRVRMLRVEAGLAQEKLADRAKLSRHYISELESGKRNPSLVVIDRIAQALNVSRSALMDF